MEDVFFSFQESLAEKSEGIILSSALKSFELIKNDDVMPGFSISQYLVKCYSRPNGLPHLVSHDENNLIKCDANCPRYNLEELCGLCIAVALKLKCLKSIAYNLGKCRNKTTTQLASQKIKNNIVDRISPALVRKSLIGSPEKSFLKI